MNDNFDRAFDYLLKNEGGYTNNQSDSGGATKYGITQHTLSGWRDKAVSIDDVQTLGRDEAKLIYWTWFWKKLNCDKMDNLVIATVIFDSAVLFGTYTATVFAQRVLQQDTYAVKDDGLIGPLTLAALNSIKTSTFVIGLQQLLRRHVNEIIDMHEKNLVFKDGWVNRIDKFSTLIA